MSQRILQLNRNHEKVPAVQQQGLFYYYHSFAKALSALGETRLEDAAGVQHDWKSELTQKLQTLQQPNGSWVNPADRWYEGDPNLVTAYCLLALSHCGPDDLH